MSKSQDTHILSHDFGDDFDPNNESTQHSIPDFVPEFESPNAIIVIFADNPKALQFQLEETVTIGRRAESGDQPDIDLAPYGGFPAGVSRLHVRVSRTRLGVLLEDLGSTNGTYVQEKRLEKENPVALQSGSSVRIGHLQAWFYFRTQNTHLASG